MEGEPPRKKRRSKWDIHPEDLHATGNQETTPPQAPTSAAAAMAAKLNAKLASEGKLKPSSAVYMVSCVHFLCKVWTGVCVCYRGHRALAHILMYCKTDLCKPLLLEPNCWSPIVVQISFSTPFCVKCFCFHVYTPFS